jgi:hypothetical protein
MGKVIGSVWIYEDHIKKCKKQIAQMLLTYLISLLTYYQKDN